VAAQLISERGTHNTTLKDIGEMAGYSRALAGSRYGSKDALFFELLQEFNRRWKDASASAVGLHTGLEALRRANHGLIAFFESESTSIRAMYMICYEMVGSSELMQRHLTDQHEAYRRGVARWIKEGLAEGEVRQDVAPESIGLLYVSAVFGLIYQWLVQPGEIDIFQGLHDLRENTIRLVSVSSPAVRGRP
jgi:AcrR family transcriptional regulator